MYESENIKYQLEALASYDPCDIDNPDFEAVYEDESGNEGFATICCIDLAKRSGELISQLEAENKKLKELNGEYDQGIGSIGLFLTKAEYSKALKEYRIVCDGIDKLNA